MPATAPPAADPAEPYVAEPWPASAVWRSEGFAEDLDLTAPLRTVQRPQAPARAARAWPALFSIRQSLA
jgi:hypothetical protein